jgi:hypothetical protein
MLIAAQRTRHVPVQVQRPQPHRPDPQREPEHRPRPRLHRRRGEHRPPSDHRIGQVRLGHHHVLPVGIHARALPQRVLQVLDQVAHLVAGAQRPARYLTRHQHDTGTGHPGDPRAHPAQPGRRPPLPPGGQLRQNPLQPATRHCQPPDPRHTPGRPHPAPSRSATCSLLRPRERTIRQGPGSTASRTVPIIDATPTANPKGAGPPPRYRPERDDQIGMFCARSADRDLYPTPKNIRQGRVR